MLGRESKDVLVSVLISFVGKKRSGGNKLVALEKGILPAQKARGVPISLDWSMDGRYIQVSTRERDLLYWCVSPHALLLPHSDAASPQHPQGVEGEDKGGGGVAGGGVEMGRDAASLAGLRAWDEFKATQESAGRATPGHGWSSWHVPFGYALQLALHGCPPPCAAQVRYV